jgi:hypothetical protein
MSGEKPKIEELAMEVAFWRAYREAYRTKGVDIAQFYAELAAEEKQRLRSPGARDDFTELCEDVDFSSGQIRIEQACYRGVLGTPKTKGSRRTLPLPKPLLASLTQTYERAVRTEEDDLVFQTRNGTPLNDTNLLHHHLKPAGRKIGMPSLSWHTLRRTHATLLQTAGASLRDTQAQLGHSRMSTTLEVYTLPIPAHLRLAVENLSQLVTNGDEFDQSCEEEPTVAE